MKWKNKLIIGVMVTFMCQFDWLWGTQIKHCFWAYLWRVILDEIIVWTQSNCVLSHYLNRLLFESLDEIIGWVCKVVCPPPCGWAPSNQLRAWMKQRQGGEWRNSLSFLSHCLAGTSHLISSSSPHIGIFTSESSGSQGFVLALNYYRLLFWVASLQMADWWTSQLP